MPGYLPTNASSTNGTTSPSAGSGQDPGFFGQNQYQVQGYNINPAAFNNPISTNQSAGGFTTGQNALLDAANANAPQIGPAATSNGAGNQGQLNVANTLYGIGTGAIPGAAAKTAALQGAQNQAANLSAMGSAVGTSNPALANYNLGQQNATVQNQTAQNAVTGAAQEQMNALGAAGSAYGGVTQNQQFNAQQIQQNAIQQATLQAQQMGLQGQELQNYIQNNAGQIANTMQSNQALQQLQVQNNLGQNQIQSQTFNNAASHSIGGDIYNLAGSGLQATGKLGVLSDARGKKNIKPGKASIDKFLTSIKGKK